jgi:tetratricopeptide (TPR) repeat protein
VHERLASAYADVGNWDAQRESLERALARTANDKDRANIHVQLGILYEEHLGNPRHAGVHYEQALAVTPRCMIALSGLERICRTSENYPRLREILDRQVDAAEDEKERTGVLVRLAELLERHFVRPREAVPKYELALELDSEEPSALDGIERCWHALREWDKLAAALERRAVASDDPLEAIAALVRLAEVRESKQEDLDAAMFAWRRVYELDTAHVQAIHELARLCEKQGDVTAAAAYRARLADLTDDPKEKARIHVTVGEMLAPPDRDPACARVHFERAVEMNPRNGAAWENLQKLAERERDMMYATFCLERRAEHADSPRAAQAAAALDPHRARPRIRRTVAARGGGGAGPRAA